MALFDRHFPHERRPLFCVAALFLASHLIQSGLIIGVFCLFEPFSSAKPLGISLGLAGLGLVIDLILMRWLVKIIAMSQSSANVAEDDGRPMESYHNHHQGGRKGIAFKFLGLNDNEGGHCRSHADSLCVGTGGLGRLGPAPKLSLSRLSHELNTSLNAILGAAQVLSTSHADSDMVSVILYTGKVMANLISDFLLLSQCQTGDLKLTQRPFSVGEMVRSIEQNFSAEAQRIGVHLGVHLQPGLPELVYGDRTRLKQILVSLLCNSFKAVRNVPREKQISIHAEISSDGLLTPKRQPPMLKFMVRDNGVGMRKEDRSGLFQPFHRPSIAPGAHPTNSDSAPGCGLGLCLCERLVQLMGGTIHLTSEVGVGTDVVFFIPAITSLKDINYNGSMSGAVPFLKAESMTFEDVRPRIRRAPTLHSPPAFLVAKFGGSPNPDGSGEDSTNNTNSKGEENGLSQDGAIERTTPSDFPSRLGGGVGNGGTSAGSCSQLLLFPNGVSGSSVGLPSSDTLDEAATVAPVAVAATNHHHSSFSALEAIPPTFSGFCHQLLHRAPTNNDVAKPADRVSSSSNPLNPHHELGRGAVPVNPLPLAVVAVSGGKQRQESSIQLNMCTTTTCDTFAQTPNEPDPYFQTADNLASIRHSLDENDGSNGGAPHNFSRENTKSSTLGGRKDRPTPVDQVFNTPGSLLPLHFVVVDDNPINRKVLVRLLTALFPAQANSISCYCDGSEVLGLIPVLSAQFRLLVLTDIHMPELGGLELTQLLRQTWDAATLPIIGVTADHTLALREECLSRGMQAVMIKPILRAGLKETVESTLRLCGWDANENAMVSALAANANASIAASPVPPPETLLLSP